MSFPDQQLLSEIHSAPREQASWQAFARLLRQRFQLVSCDIRLHCPDEELTSLNTFDAAAEVRAFYQQHEQDYLALTPFNFAAMENGWVYRWEDCISREDLLQSAFYTDLCRPMGFEYAMCMSVQEPAGRRLWLSVIRGNGQENFSEGERVKFQRLFAHLRHCLKALAIAG